MNYDPLSVPTRRTRRALLAVSGVTILGKFFCAHIEGLPLSGIALSFDEALIDVALILTLTYLIILFVVYSKIDWTNRGRTPAQVAEADARQAVLIEVERHVRAVATREAIRHGMLPSNPDVAENIVGVFWRFKSNMDVEKPALHRVH